MDVTSLIGIGDAEDLKTSEGIARLCQIIAEREKQVDNDLEKNIQKVKKSTYKIPTTN